MGGMKVASLSALAFLTWLLGLAARAAMAAPPPELSRTLDGTQGEGRLPVVGLMLDAGVPDGVIGSLVVRPAAFARLHLGGGSNSASPGLRGGVSIIPVGQGPSFTVEVGHYRAGDTNALLGGLLGGLGKFGSYVHRFSYTFANAHAGIELGGRHVTVFIHGGFSYLRATLSSVHATPEQDPSLPGRISLTFTRDPIVRLFTPSAKLGLVVYLE
jgi:hypothetical protein